MPVVAIVSCYLLYACHYYDVFNRVCARDMKEGEGEDPYEIVSCVDYNLYPTFGDFIYLGITHLNSPIHRLLDHELLHNVNTIIVW